jgi:hypothetical protein
VTKALTELVNLCAVPHASPGICSVERVAKFSKREICEGGVVGGEKVHGYTPDGNLLCGAQGDGGSDPYPFEGPNHEDPADFDPSASNASKRCSASYRRLPD